MITHVLRTRAPLSPTPKSEFSFDLHVLGPPQTFALSQDQTLQFDAVLASVERTRNRPLTTEVARDVFGLRSIAASRFPHTSSTLAPRGSRWMGDHPVFRYPVFRERCSEDPEGFRRWGWVCSQPGVSSQADSRSAFEGFRTSRWSLAASASFGPRSATLRVAGPGGPSSDLLSPGAAPPLGWVPSSGEVDATDPSSVRKPFLLVPETLPPRLEFGAVGRF